MPPSTPPATSSSTPSGSPQTPPAPTTPPVPDTTLAAAKEAPAPAVEPKAELIQARVIIAGGGYTYGEVIQVPSNDPGFKTRFVPVDKSKATASKPDPSTDDAMAALAAEGATDGEGEAPRV